ncbi:MAG: hypothetical protein IPN94_17235 [Sphingobacteriales bacterium]|nr:hypothetical protein [Sphingobacteriales bacterium]
MENKGFRLSAVGIIKQKYFDADIEKRFLLHNLWLLLFFSLQPKQGKT